ncbi:MAG: rod shape-determining protein MreC [Myxococcales bacterium]|nr:rod shape-determining protein MreC [Myxococcales bacterium]
MALMAIYAALAVFLLQFDRRGERPGPLGSVVVSAVGPLQRGVSVAGEGVRAIWLDYVALVDVRRENRELQAQVTDLQTRAVAADDLRAENERLRRLLDLGDRRKDLRLRAARVTSRAVSPYFRVVRVVLDVSQPGPAAEAGMPVIAPGGVVGMVRAVNGGEAEVLLVTDPRSAIDVVLEQSRARGVAKGSGEPDRYVARLQYLQKDVKAVDGERVLTTGDDGRYPRGLVVGRVRTVTDDGSGPFQKADVLPMVDLNALDEVFVVMGDSGLTEDGGAFVDEKHKGDP